MMTYRTVLIAIGIGLALGACNTTTMAERLNIEAEPVGRIAYGGVRLEPENGGFGLLLLVRGNEERNIQACNAFKDAIIFKRRVSSEDEIQYPRSGQSLPERPVYWLDSRASGPADISDCRLRVQNYNYVQANMFLTRLGMLSKDGPILAVWKENGAKKTEAKAGVFDLTDTPKDEFRKTIRVFAEYLSHEVDAWDAEFYQEATLREKIKKFMDEDLQLVGVLITPAFAGSK